MKPTTPMTAFQARRKQLLQSIGEAILILPAAPEQTRNRDCHYPYRQDSDFLYLSNFNEPSAIMVLDGKNQQSILFSKPYDELYTIWEGEIIGQQRAEDEYLFDKAYEIDKFNEQLLACFYAFDTVISPFGRYLDFDANLLKQMKTAKETRRARAPQNWLHSDQFIHPMRLCKDKHEIANMQYASAISAKAHNAAMQATQPGMNEAQIQAIFDQHFGQAGGEHAYNAIVAGGNNACTLHYTVNNAQLLDGDLLLIDAGCEINGYAADITRTFPVNGRFTTLQKRVYEWVLKALEAALAACQPGNHIRSPHFAAEAVLIDAMLDLGLLSGTRESVQDDNSYQRYFMHGTSHWLGIDVHDVGDYKDENGEWLKLLPGMVITVEPGLYIRKDDKNAPAGLRGIGIRIEDNVVINDNGYQNLSLATPKSVAEIEASNAVVPIHTSGSNH